MCWRGGAGGELAAVVLVDACVRLLRGVMGREGSLAEESFADGLLEYPQYTRPQIWEDRPIPDVLVGGDHGKVAAWRRGGCGRRARPGAPGPPSGTPIGPKTPENSRFSAPSAAGPPSAIHAPRRGD